jgi:hypothetical protein
MDSTARDPQQSNLRSVKQTDSTTSSSDSWGSARRGPPPDRSKVSPGKPIDSGRISSHSPSHANVPSKRSSSTPSPLSPLPHQTGSHIAADPPARRSRPAIVPSREPSAFGGPERLLRDASVRAPRALALPPDRFASPPRGRRTVRQYAATPDRPPPRSRVGDATRGSLDRTVRSADVDRLRPSAFVAGRAEPPRARERRRTGSRDRAPDAFDDRPPHRERARTHSGADGAHDRPRRPPSPRGRAEQRRVLDADVRPTRTRAPKSPARGEECNRHKTNDTDNRRRGVRVSAPVDRKPLESSPRVPARSAATEPRLRPDRLHRREVPSEPPASWDFQFPEMPQASNRRALIKIRRDHRLESVIADLENE